VSDLLPVAVRAFARPLHARRKPRPASPRPRRRNAEVARRPSAVLVVDCETTVDAVQALRFGAHRYCRVDWTEAGPNLVCVEEGLFYADELDAEQLACLEEYV
jgi:hypothetical protein